MNPSSSTGSAPKKRSPTAPSKASTTRFEWLPDDPTAFAPMRPWKSRCITTWDDCRSQNQPTDSAEEAEFHPPSTATGCRPWPDHSSTDSERADGGTGAQDRRRSVAASCIMPPPRTYTTAGAFRRALEERLKRASVADQIDLNRLRRQVSFDRLLARLFREEPAPWVLKGGYALEIRTRSFGICCRKRLTFLSVTGLNSSLGRRSWM